MSILIWSCLAPSLIQRYDNNIISLACLYEAKSAQVHFACLFIVHRNMKFINFVFFLFPPSIFFFHVAIYNLQTCKQTGKRHFMILLSPCFITIKELWVSWYIHPHPTVKVSMTHFVHIAIIQRKLVCAWTTSMMQRKRKVNPSILQGNV